MGCVATICNRCLFFLSFFFFNNRVKVNFYFVSSISMYFDIYWNLKSLSYSRLT